MNLSELHADKGKMCQWLGLTEEQLRAEYIRENPYVGGWIKTKTEDDPDFKRMTVADLVTWYIGGFHGYRTREGRKLSYPFGERTYTQFVQECLRSLGLTKGSVDAKRQRAIELWPQFFEAPPAPEPPAIAWMHGKQPQTA